MNDGVRSLRPTAPSMLLCIAVLACFLAGGATAANGQKRTIYAVATQAQYVNYVGKIAPAHDHNPFNADAKLPVPQKGQGGSDPGQLRVLQVQALFERGSQAQHRDRNLYACSFTFNQHATCDAYYDLNDGTLFASGPVDFRTTEAPLAVTGGTSSISERAARSSRVDPVPILQAKNETRLDFILVGH